MALWGNRWLEGQKMKSLQLATGAEFYSGTQRDGSLAATLRNCRGNGFPLKIDIGPILGEPRHTKPQ